MAPVVFPKASICSCSVFTRGRRPGRPAARFAPHRPDALQHHLSGPQVAPQPLLGDDADQSVRELDAQAIELADRDGNRVARPAGTAGMAFDEAALSITNFVPLMLHQKEKERPWSAALSAAHAP